MKDAVLLPGGSVKAVLDSSGDDFFCVAFFWKNNEALLTADTVNSLQRSAFTILRFCEAQQPQLPVDLSVFAACLHSGAITLGNAPRGIVAVDPSLAWSYDPAGHMFQFTRPPISGSLLSIVVFWLPAPGRIDVQ